MKKLSLQKRFRFGRNWSKYSELVDESRIRKAVKHLQDRFYTDKFAGLFVAIGCGSGVFSAAASIIGAQVYSFDYDEDSVKTTEIITSKFGKKENLITIEQGDILSDRYDRTLANAEYIYSWGVLHHTGDMWKALDKIAVNSRPETKFVVALYNDLGEQTDKWAKLKAIYVKFFIVRPFVIFYAWYRFWAKQQLRSLITGQDPFRSWREYSIDSRGMSAWYDLIDWSGGYPYERATIESVENFMHKRGWITINIWPNHGIGCNEFLFEKIKSV